MVHARGDLDGKEKQPALGVPPHAHLRFVDEHAGVGIAGDADMAGSGHDLTLEPERRGIRRQLGPHGRGDRRVGVELVVADPQRQQQILRRHVAGDRLDQALPARARRDGGHQRPRPVGAGRGDRRRAPAHRGDRASRAGPRSGLARSAPAARRSRAPAAAPNRRRCPAAWSHAEPWPPEVDRPRASRTPGRPSRCARPGRRRSGSASAAGCCRPAGRGRKCQARPWERRQRPRRRDRAPRCRAAAVPCGLPRCARSGCRRPEHDGARRTDPRWRRSATA